MRTFKAGDRVAVLQDNWDVGIKDKLATVIRHTYGDRVEIAVDNWEGGHGGSSGRVVELLNRWNVKADDIRLSDVTPIDDDVVDVDPIIDVPLLPVGAEDRKAIPLASGLMDYFPAALAEVAKVSFKGNAQHNPGQPLHWARGKSTDHADTMLRHFLERGTIDTDGVRHSAKVAWRALAACQEEMENDGYPKARGAK